MGDNRGDAPLSLSDCTTGNALPGFDLTNEFVADQMRRKLAQNPGIGGVSPPGDAAIDSFSDHIATLRRGEVPNPISPRPPAEPARDGDNFHFVGRNGAVSMRRSDDGTLNYSDSRERLTSFDGRTWLRENGDLAFQGTIRMEGGNLIRENHYGVTTEERPDGSETRRMRTSTGDLVQIHTSAIPVGGSANDRTITVVDSTGTYVSTDGGESYTQRGADGRFTDGPVSVRRGIDDYGNYWSSNDCLPDRHVEARTPQADRFHARQREIEERYGVRITPPDVSYPAVGADGVTLTTRQPTMLDLDALERSLSRSTRDNNDGLEFAFIRDTPAARSVQARGRYVARDTNYIELFDWQHSSRGPNGVEGVIDHELAHHEQQIDGQDGGRWNAELNRLYHEMGWTGERLRDHDGNLWTWVPARRQEPEHWTSPSSSQPLSPRQMRERAQVRPPSDYFTAPWEMHAEAVRLYRTDREALMRENPDLYARIRTSDQDQIDRRHGTNSGGGSRMIRDLDGRIIANTAQDRRRISAAERDWQASQWRVPVATARRPQPVARN